MDSVRVILQAVQAGNYDLAFQTAKKEVQKDPENGTYLSLQLYTAGLMNDRQTVLETAKLACPKASAKTTQMFLAPTFLKFFEPELLLQAFSNAYRKEPTNVKLSQDWLDSALQIGDLPGAQKAMMAGLKHAKTNEAARKACYQVCLVMALIPDVPLFTDLANKMLEKHLPCITADECYVAALVFRKKDQSKLVEYLSKEAQVHLEGSIELQLLLLEGLIETKDFEGVFNYAVKQLKSINSFNYFEALNTAAVELQRVSDALDFINSLESHGFNQALAKIDLATKVKNQELDVDEQIVNYWSKYKSKLGTFKYFEKYITKDNISKLEAEPSFSNVNDVAAYVNLLKLRKFLGTSLVVDELVQNYESCKKFIPKEKTDYFVGTDLLLLAAETMLKSESDYKREQAVCLLEYALKADPCNFSVKCQLIHIYRSLNVFSRALHFYSDLSIQNLQHETLGHWLSMRLSTTVPDQVPVIQRRLEKNRENADKAGIYSSTALNMGGYRQFQGIFELGTKLVWNMHAVLLDLEKIKSARILRGTPLVTDLYRLPDTSKLLDVRDYTTAVNICEVGPKQGSEFLRLEIAKELAVKEKNIQHIAELPSRISKELTTIEQWCFDVICEVLDPEYTNNNPEGTTPKTLPELPELDFSLQKGNSPDWELYNYCYTILDTVKLTRQAKNVHLDLKPSLTNLVTSVTNDLNSYSSSASKSIKYGDKDKILRIIVEEHRKNLKKLKSLL